MADVKISALPVAATPLAGTEVLPIVQSGTTDQVSVANLTAGRTVAAATLNVDANSADAAIRVTQLGAGNALLVEDSANPDATPFVVNASGQVLIGRTTAPFGSTSLGIEQAVADSAPSNIDFLKNRAGAIVNNNDGLGRIRFWGYDGAAPKAAAEIVVAVDGTPGTNDMPGRIVFNTTADGASTVTERMRIDSSGNVGIGTSSTSGYRVAVVGSTASSIPLYFNTDTTTSYVYTPNNLYLGSTGAFPVVAITNNTERLRIDSSGNVGIGTSSPFSLLHLNKGSGAADIRLSVAGTLYGIAYASSSDMTITSVTAISLKFGTNNTERMQIDSSGNIVAGGSVALATTATNGFLYVPTCAGVPTGTPTAITGMAPIVVNTTNNKLYFYSGGAWRDAGP